MNRTTLIPCENCGILQRVTGSYAECWEEFEIDQQARMNELKRLRAQLDEAVGVIREMKGHLFSFTTMANEIATAFLNRLDAGEGGD